MPQKKPSPYLIIPILLGAILVVLCIAVSYRIRNQQTSGISLQAINDMHAINAACTQFLTISPGEELTLQALATPSPNGKRPAILRQIPRDPWGNDYELATNANKIFLFSPGPDGEANTEDDLVMSFPKHKPDKTSSTRPTIEDGTTLVYPLADTDFTSHKSIILGGKDSYWFISCSPEFQQQIDFVYFHLIDKDSNSLGDVKLTPEKSTGFPSGITYGVNLNKTTLTENSYFVIHLKDNSTYQVHFHPLEYDFACYRTITHHFDNDKFLCESHDLETKGADTHTFEDELKYTYVSKDGSPPKDPASFWKIHQNRLELSLAHYLAEQTTKIQLNEEWTLLYLKQGQVCYISTSIDPFGSFIIRIRNTDPKTGQKHPDPFNTPEGTLLPPGDYPPVPSPIEKTNSPQDSLPSRNSTPDSP